MFSWAYNGIIKREELRPCSTSLTTPYEKSGAYGAQSATPAKSSKPSKANPRQGGG